MMFCQLRIEWHKGEYQIVIECMEDVLPSG